MDARPRDIFYNDFMAPNADRVEDVDGIKVPTPTEIGISELPDDDPSLRESGRAFLRFFEAHEDRVIEIQNLDELQLEEYKACLKKLEYLKVELWDAQAEAQLKKSNKCTRIRQKIHKTERMLRILPIYAAVARIAQCEGQIQYCEIAYNVYLTNSTGGGNDALALLVGELSMRSPYGVIELEMLENIGLKRFREKRTKELEERWAARAAEEAVTEESEGETDYETAKEDSEEEAEDGWEGFDANEAEGGAEDAWEGFDAKEADFEGFDAPKGEKDAGDTTKASDATLTSRKLRKVNRKRKHTAIVD